MRQFLFCVFLALPFTAFANAQKYEVAIDGMTCADCAKAVSMALDKVPNIDRASVHVNLKGKSAELTMKDNDKETMGRVKKAIEDSGYTVKSIHTVAGDAPGAASAAKKN